MNRVPFMKSYDVIGYAADADIWCLDCFREAGYDPEGQDHEGNDVHPVFVGSDNSDEEVCGCCHEKLMG